MKRSLPIRNPRVCFYLVQDLRRNDSDAPAMQLHRVRWWRGRALRAERKISPLHGAAASV